MAAGCGAVAADRSHEVWSGSSSIGSAEPQSPMSRPAMPAGPRDDLPASERRWTEHARVENVLRGTAGSWKGWLQTGCQRCDAHPLDLEEELEDVKCRRLVPHAVGWSRHAGEEHRALRQQLHAMHKLLKQPQQGLVQSRSVGKDLGEDGHGDEQQRECHLQAHLCSECREGARTGQTKQADSVRHIIMSNKEQQELSGALKRELSKAVSRSVDLVFDKISSALAKDSSRLLGGGKRKFEEVSSIREPSLTADEVTAQPPEHKDTDKVLIPTEQTEALSLVVPKLCSIRHRAEDQQVPYQMPPSPYKCEHRVAFGENQLLEHLLRCSVHSDPRSPHCGLAVGDGSPSHSLDIPQHRDKVRSKPSSSVGTLPTPLERPRIPHNKAEDETLQRSPCVSLTEGLSPSHLKKAKLMFFYTRYPSSNVLKCFFPDVKFTRCVTSQLIKWFSNFREFYYIQMERFARRAVLERGTSAEGLSVSRDSELFRALNAHYNKANDFQVPDRFLEVAEITLKQFFNSILLAKDTDPSWKKAIYKVICKLDSDIPDYFKSFACS
ncbi:prospero homeobox protein 1-like [Scleropages formosus]|uniref:Prospero homeobox protein 1-like n=1 Tax=Scleropages formosus TaxID=113540 RepID=A0A8C9TLX1_SCLFO|nr:prospero homeobox protein 1-like [Scleropages formosus]XP_029105877.1 prospero homeobox protein 1-like [Scleropages formosus]